LTLELCGFPQIIGVLEGYDLTASNPCTAITRDSGASVVLYDDSNAITVSLELGLSLIGGAVVHNDDFHVLVGLLQDIINRPANNAGAVESRDDHTDQWTWLHNVGVEERNVGAD
jgi:hypothetical protein